MLAPWKKSYDKPRQHTKKQRHYFTNKGPYSQSYGFSSSHVWKWELDHKESWAPKNWCFWTMVLEKTLESPLEDKTSQSKGNWSFGKGPFLPMEYSLEGLMLKLKLQYFGHLIQRTDSMEKTIILGKTEGRKKRGWLAWMAWRSWWTWVWISSKSWWRTGKLGMLQSLGLQRVRHNWVTEVNWTEHGPAH